jgi:hypothetical protein
VSNGVVDFPELPTISILGESERLYGSPKGSEKGSFISGIQDGSATLTPPYESLGSRTALTSKPRLSFRTVLVGKKQDIPLAISGHQSVFLLAALGPRPLLEVCPP